jgi:hypothetical protein
VEQWRDVVGYEGLYQVSDQGRVRSVDRYVTSILRTSLLKGKIRKLKTHKDGYSEIDLYKGGVRRTFLVHGLMMIAFVGPRPEGMQVLHIDSDPTNNTVDNLRWGTPKENVRDEIDRGTHNFFNGSYINRSGRRRKEGVK